MKTKTIIIASILALAVNASASPKKHHYTQHDLLLAQDRAILAADQHSIDNDTGAMRVEKQFGEKPTTEDLSLLAEHRAQLAADKIQYSIDQDSK